MSIELGTSSAMISFVYLFYSLFFQPKNIEFTSCKSVQPSIDTTWPARQCMSWTVILVNLSDRQKVAYFTGLSLHRHFLFVAALFIGSTIAQRGGYGGKGGGGGGKGGGGGGKGAGGGGKGGGGHGNTFFLFIHYGYDHQIAFILHSVLTMMTMNRHK